MEPHTLDATDYSNPWTHSLRQTPQADAPATAAGHRAVNKF